MAIGRKIFKRILGGFIFFSVLNFMFTLFIENLDINVEIWIWNLSKFIETLVIFLVNIIFFSMLYGLKSWGIGK